MVVGVLIDVLREGVERGGVDHVTFWRWKREDEGVCIMGMLFLSFLNAYLAV